MIGYLFLGAAILLEIFSTSMLKLSMGFTKLIPSVVFVVGMSSSFYVLSKALNLDSPQHCLCHLVRYRDCVNSPYRCIYLERRAFYDSCNWYRTHCNRGNIIKPKRCSPLIGRFKVYNIIPCIRGPEVGSFYFTKKESHLNLKVH